jgi:HK97 family phage prohead protease
MKEIKSVHSILTDDVEGKVEAVFSVFNEIDSDGDVVRPNSIKSGYGDEGVAMVWGHDWKDVIGRGEIVQDNDKAVFKGQFIMDTERGRDAYNVVKAMGDLQQWSFGYEVVDSEKGMFQSKDGELEQEVRFLNDVKVWEVSPVLVGANQNTYTIGVKEFSKDDLSNNDTDIDIDNTENGKDIEQSLVEGKTFADEVTELRTSLVALIDRTKDLTSLRLEKEKQLSKESSDLLVELQLDLEKAYGELADIFAIALPEDKKERINVDEYNELIANRFAILNDTLGVIGGN